MSVRRDQQRFSVAALLLFLLTAFAISPPEALYRGQPNRTRASRTVRLDDHDHDHSQEAVQLLSDSTRDGQGDGFDIAALPAGVSTALQVVLAGGELIPALSSPSYLVSCRRPYRGRAPPLQS